MKPFDKELLQEQASSTPHPGQGLLFSLMLCIWIPLKISLAKGFAFGFFPPKSHYPDQSLLLHTDGTVSTIYYM